MALTHGVGMIMVTGGENWSIRWSMLQVFRSVLRVLIGPTNICESGVTRLWVSGAPSCDSGLYVNGVYGIRKVWGCF